MIKWITPVIWLFNYYMNISEFGNFNKFYIITVTEFELYFESSHFSRRLPRIQIEMLTLTVVFAGTVCDFRLSYGRVLSRKSKIIAVNRDRMQLLKNSDMFWKPTLAVQGMFSKAVVYILHSCCDTQE